MLRALQRLAKQERDVVILSWRKIIQILGGASFVAAIGAAVWFRVHNVEFESPGSPGWTTIALLFSCFFFAGAALCAGDLSSALQSGVASGRSFFDPLARADKPARYWVEVALYAVAAVGLTVFGLLCCFAAFLAAFLPS